MGRLLGVVAVVFVALMAMGTVSAQESGWRVTSFDAAYTVNSDGVVDVVEQVQVDFGTLQKHGIYRDLIERRDCAARVADPAAQQPVFPCKDGFDRVWRYENVAVTTAEGKAITFERESTVALGESVARLKIGDADRTISGKQAYRISYRLRGALDAYDDHDELYWNALGTWQVPVERTTVKVTLPSSATPKATCFQGASQSTAQCRSGASGNTLSFTATRPLQFGEQLTVVAGWQKNLVAVGPPILEDRVSLDDFFTLDVWELGGMVLVAAAGFAGLMALWWRHGRDRRYRTLFYLTNDPGQQTKPLFARTDIVVEFLPPEGWRPAQMGLVLDERADTLDVTATIIDLAVRGYVHITEIPKEGWFGHNDWQLNKVKPADDELLPYERELFNSLFDESKEEVTISSLKNKFAGDLQQVKKDLYADGMKREWFDGNPQSMRTLWFFGGMGLVIIGVLASIGSGLQLSRALIPVPLVFAGLFLMVMSRAMARRTATGSEALRRVLGFRLYITTAETRRQEFNEQKNIFARYLPFAIVFGCVDKWAKAFEGLDDMAESSTASWYTGVGPFQVMAFSAGLRSFSTGVSSTIASTASSGGSGFSGGFSGGGGGGGGGGSW
jgi:uncharacterized membrane protein YgcG